MLAVVLLTMLPAFVLIVFNTIDERQRAIDLTRQGALSTVRLIAAQQSQLIANTRQVMEVVANSDELIDGDTATCERYLNRIFQATEGYIGLSVARPNGDVYCAAPRRSMGQALDASERPYFQKALATRQFIIGDFQVGTSAEMPSISFGYPVLSPNGQVKDIIWAAWSIDRLNDLTQGWQLPAGTSVVLMDSQGTVVTRFPQWQNWVGKQFRESELFTHMQQQTEGTVRIPGLDGVKRWFAFTTVGADPILLGAPTAGSSFLYLAAGYSDTVFMQDVNGRLLLSLATLGLLSLLGPMIAYGMTDWMIGRPARRMMAITREIQRGNWTARTNMTRKDGELGELGRTLDEMADALQQRDERFQTINAELEERVATRTQELASANSQLKASQDELRRLSQDLLDLTEQERARVAEAVSEQLGQGLTGIKMDLTLAQRQLGTGRDKEALAHLKGAIGTLDQIVAAAREIAGGLRPSVLDDFGLAAAVEGQLAEFTRRTGVAAKLEADVDEAQLTNAVSTAAFRVLQEALTNVGLHAHASEVLIGMRTKDGFLTLIVQDNGQGFQPGDLLKPQAMGVLGMRERAVQLGGTLKVIASPETGTRLTLALPIKAGPATGSRSE